MYAKQTNVDSGKRPAHANVLANMEAWLNVFQEPASEAQVRAVHNEVLHVILRWQLKPPAQRDLEAIFDQFTNQFWRERWSDWLRAASTTLRVRVPLAKADQAELIRRFIEKMRRGQPQAEYEASSIVDALQRRIGDNHPTAVTCKALLLLSGIEPDPDYAEVEHMVYHDASWSPAVRKTLGEEFSRQQAFVKSLRETPSLNIPPYIWPSTVRYAAKQAGRDLEQGYADGNTDRMRAGINTLISLLAISAAQGKDQGRSMVEMLADEMHGQTAAAEELLNRCMQAVSANVQPLEKQPPAPARTAWREHCLIL